MNYLARLFFASVLLTAPRAFAADMPPPMAALAAKVAPAIVSITALSPTGPNTGRGGNDNSAGNSDTGDGDNEATVQKDNGLVIPPPQTLEALGSGFIFEPSGYILTNNHVVQGATDVTVTLSDGTVYPAVIAGLDPKADLAVLKINTGHPMPFLTFGDSAKMQIGDWVLAIGNPYGMSNTNTAGIVSALHRQIGDTAFDDFIQTDAAINRGNSGGPLLNMQGQVIGVNAAIYSPSGTSDGIGFSIPSAMAQPVSDALVRNGKMTRGWLGVSIEEVSPAIGQALHLPDTNGALVGAVAANSPASGTLQPGDVITALAGASIDNPRALFIRTAEIQAGQSVEVNYIRNGTAAQAALIVTVPPPTGNENAALNAANNAEPLMLPAYGLGISNKPGTQGAVVTLATGPAATAGLEAGDLITQMDGFFIANAAQLAQDLQKRGADPAVLFVTHPAKENSQPMARWLMITPQPQK